MAQDHYTIEDDVLRKFNDKLGEHGPALYVLAFNVRGNAVLFTKEGLEVQHHTERNRVFAELKEKHQQLQITRLDCIQIALSEKVHLVQQTYERKDAGDPPCGGHSIAITAD